MTLTNGGSFTDKVNFIWSVADLLRRTYKRNVQAVGVRAGHPAARRDPPTRLSAGGTKPAVLGRAAELAGNIENADAARAAVSGHEFYNLAPIDDPSRKE